MLSSVPSDPLNNEIGISMSPTKEKYSEGIIVQTKRAVMNLLGPDYSDGKESPVIENSESDSINFMLHPIGTNTSVEVEFMNSKKFVCVLCQYPFTSKQTLKLHVDSVHLGMRPFTCYECGKGFSQTSSLSLHMKAVHQRLKPYKCEECHSTFSQNGSLTLHIRAIHRGIKPFECGYCGRRYATNFGRHKHISIVHEKVTPLKCEKCSELFSDRTDLTNHVDLVHTELKAFKCKLCEDSFIRRPHLNAHLARFHKDEIISNEDRRLLILQAFQQGFSVIEAAQRISRAWSRSGKSPSRRSIQHWYKKFKSKGDAAAAHLTDAPRAGRPSHFPEEALADLLAENPRQTVRKLASRLSSSNPSVLKHLRKLGRVWQDGSWVQSHTNAA